LYDQQVALRINPAPKPQRLGVKCLAKSLLRTKWYKKRQELADKGEGTIKDIYLPSQIPDHHNAVWQHKNPAIAFRTHVDFLFGNHILLRSNNRLALELPDLFVIYMPNEGIKENVGDEFTMALTALMNQGKTNQHGNMEYGACLRHRDPHGCLLNGLAFYFFWRWQMGEEPFPEFAHNEQWYEIKVIQQSAKAPTTPLSYKSANEWTKTFYKLSGIQGSKTTHLPRVAGAQNADILGVDKAHVYYPFHLYPTLSTLYPPLRLIHQNDLLPFLFNLDLVPS
jgi:hypothetical protein